ncbi:MAG: hypothetical protein J6W94_00110 [Bacteroidales bacterium]|nr:hypothetical protein [Bacteroidales bacterium]
MSQKLSFPNFSVVFIQTFSVHHTMEFILPERAVKEMDTPFQEKEVVNKKTGACRYFEKADALRTPIALVRKTSMENLIFTLPPNSPFEAPPKTRKRLFRKPRRIPMKGNVRRYSLRGFDFSMDIVAKPDEEIPHIKLSGHCNVEMNLFFGHTASITYRFLFNGIACSLSGSEKKEAITDHIIVFLSTWLNAERWDDDNIEYPTVISVKEIWFNSDGDPLEEPDHFDTKDSGSSFDEIAIRYKNYIYKYCTQFKENISWAKQKWLRKDWVQPQINGYINKNGIDAWKKLPCREKRRLKAEWASHPFDLERDSRYAMVDIWEDVRNVSLWGVDIFKDKKKGGWMSEAQIIDHIRSEHKDELVGLLSLYPEEWIYRDPEAYDEVCGENIAIDTDDLVLAGSNLCVVIGTYGRRGEGESGNNWAKHLEGRAHFHVSWPEYLLIVQMILAKKYIIGLATDELIASTMNVEKKVSENALIKQNAALSMRLTRLVTQLDILKYARYPSHKVMYNRTSRRLGLDEDYERLNTLMETIDSSLHNTTEYKAMKSDFILNVILGVVSVVSSFELLYQDPKLGFVSKLFNLSEDTDVWGSRIIAGVAVLAITAVVFILGYVIKAIFSGIRSIRYE